MLKDSAAVLLATAVLVAGLEGGLRAVYAVRNAAVSAVVLPYTAAQDWGPVPPWLDGLRILEPDPVLLWRNRANVRRRYLDVYGPVASEADRLALLQRFWPRVPPALRGRPTWSVAIGSHGFRTHEFDREKPPGTFRVVCVGDSWTFGANVDQADAYPQHLAELLRGKPSRTEVEVLNLGVMGYSSWQGLELLQRSALELRPDVVLIGFGMNDSVVAGWHDRDSVGAAGAGPQPGWLERIETLRLARYFVQRVQHEPWTIGDYLARVSQAAGSSDELWTGRQAVEFASEETLARVARVPPAEYATKLRAMLRRANAHGARAVLLYNELWDTPYRDALARVAADEGVAWIDTRALLEAERRRRGDARARQLRLQAEGSAAAGFVLRVDQGEHDVPRSLYVAGSHPALGGGVPNRVALHDDGTHGDERAGDRVWSLAFPVEPGVRLFYVYTNSGREGRWEGLDVPDLRHRPAGGPGYGPIERFGELVLQADGWHTDADGYRLLARAAADVIEPWLP